MERAAFADGALPKKQKELIAIGISVVKNCESCMQWHIEQAVSRAAQRLMKSSKRSKWALRWAEDQPLCRRGLRLK